ncbi:hypothetical protein [Stenotrophomonas indicatrix]|uniref:hypothetical protein n=1 Tax=Stenotrophomonas indicatrix TaxID=2045451 RepID=UPI001070C35F|nr:hypothetical protein [Stenotrophomonas indicatrix]
MIDVNVAESIYCSPFQLICQPLSWWSSAASWAQAFLTVCTFAIALFAQRRQQMAAEAKQDALRRAAEKKEDSLRDAAEKKEHEIRAEAARKEEEIRLEARREKERGEAISALVAAIPLKTRLLDALSVAEVVATTGSVTSLSETFVTADHLLDLRNGAAEAARLLDASEPVLRAIHVAEVLWSYLEVRKHVRDADAVSVAFIEQLGTELRLRTLEGINALDRILQPPAQG